MQEIADNERFQLQINENYHCDLFSRCLAAIAISTVVFMVVVGGGGASADDYVAWVWAARAYFEMLSSRIFRFSAIGVALYDTSGDNILSSKFIIKNR